MIVYDILFYVFAFLMVSSAMAVVSVRNPVYAVFCLIFAFFNVAGIFVLLGAEFLAMSLVIVYVGAVAILFLFVVMMLNINIENIRKYLAKERKFLMILAIALAVELIAILYASLDVDPVMLAPSAPLTIDATKSNTHQLGLLLYTDYGYLFQICGFILFAAIISAIMLTHRNPRSKKQNEMDQLSRNRENSVTLVKVQSNKGVDVIHRD